MTTAITQIEQPVMEPWFFDPIAWWQDTRDLSPIARAVWFDILCLMHFASPRGYLVDRNGDPLDDDFLSKRLNVLPGLMTCCLMEIRNKNKCSVDDLGRWYCRRMVRERKTGEDLKTVAERYQLNPPKALKAWIVWWNTLVQRKLVVGYLTESKPALSLCRAWVRTEKNAELKRLLARKADIEKAICQATFTLKWLSLADLFGGKNGNGEYKVQRLLEGRYGNASEQQSRTVSKLGGLADFVRQQRGAGG